MPVNLEEARWVAHLARLDLNAQELEIISRQLSSILDYFNQLGRLDTDRVEPLAHPLPLSNVFRDDVHSKSLSIDQALANAPDRRGDFYAVPAVLE